VNQISVSNPGGSVHTLNSSNGGQQAQLAQYLIQ